MTIPNLPSDSLYKFLAFFGMSLLIVVIILSVNDYRKITDKVVGYNAMSREIGMKDSLMWREAKDKLLADAEYLSKRHGIENPFSATDTSFKWTMIFRGTKEEMALSDTIKKLLERYNERLHILNEKKIEREVNDYLISEAEKELRRNHILFVILLLLSGIICSVGFGLWYDRIQAPSDIKAARELCLTPVIKGRCQSCNVDFSNFQNHRGSEKDGTTNNYFCSVCYKNGQFTNSELTLQEMKASIHRDLIELGVKQRKIKKILSQIDLLQRWNKKTKY